MTCPDYKKDISHFHLTTEDEKKTSEWFNKHVETCKKNKTVNVGIGTMKAPLWSPIYSFVQTGIGTVTTVSCVCGEELDFSEYDLW